MKQNPYPAQSLLGKIFDLLKIKERPITVTNTAVVLGSTYAAVYRAVYNDKIKAVNFEHRDGVRHIALNAEFKNKEPELSINETIQDVMVNDVSEYGLHVHEIAQKAHATQPEVRAFIKEQVGLGNIEVNPTQGKHGHRYRWAGPINSSITEEMLVIAKEVEAESISEAKLDPIVEEDLPSDTPETAQEKPTLQESKAMTETTATTAQPLAPKVRYLIEAAKGKRETANSEKSAERIAERFANEGCKNIRISMVLPFAKVRKGIEVKRIW
ncbi:ribosomal protein S24E/predicted transcriptional regulator [Paenalcaligenes hominis]|uniref:Ribosomal protein S24E/predicted transcriptional regulator n=1 Tax=Paenalcaligenes hominis TaxID=643674 RepID=A0ABX0WM39_9BURK|nr:hypothetical protein [Paenalcaligenes hominis]NJB64299.1 ribosomal protein S24E/predicted transcriptional regulator [Paenalcaligenes hominis]GGE68696.1 hypothetical protein GCM10007278_16000 [Paenalcaligenes hominis]